METWKIISVVLISIYLSIVVGIIVRFIDEDKKYLCVLALFIPALVMIFDMKLIIKTLFKSKRKIKNRIKNFLGYLFLFIVEYNIVVELNIQLFVKSSLNEKIKALINKKCDLENVKLIKNMKLRTLYHHNEEFFEQETKQKIFRKA